MTVKLASNLFTAISDGTPAAGDDELLLLLPPHAATKSATAARHPALVNR
jgi:hypothetical protein